MQRYSVHHISVQIHIDKQQLMSEHQLVGYCLLPDQTVLLVSEEAESEDDRIAIVSVTSVHCRIIDHLRGSELTTFRTAGLSEGHSVGGRAVLYR